MSEKFAIEIISPDRTVIKTSAIEAIIPSFEGEMGILKGHIPLITFLRPGIIKVISDTEKKFFVEDGTVEFSNDNLLVLTSTAQELSAIDKNSIEALLKDAKTKLNNTDITDKEKYLLSYKIDTLQNINL